jgi:type VI secretion system secreted protein Hcp
MTRSRLFKLALPAAVALGAGTAVAIAAIPSTSGQIIKACYQTAPATARTLRLVDADNAAETCTAGEATLTWNQQGPTGPVGPVGPQGDPGPPGDSGSGGSGSGGSGGTGGGSPFDTSQTGGPTADIFLALDGIPGDSTDAQHKNEIAIESFAFLAKRTTTSKSTRFSGLRLDKVYDVSSPRLFAAATSGRHIKSAVVTFSTSADPSGTNVVTYKLSDVTLTSYEQGGANPDTKPLGSLEEEIGLTPARVQVTERTFGADGKPGPVVTASWQVPKASKR